MSKRTKIDTTRLASDIIYNILDISQIDWNLIANQLSDEQKIGICCAAQGFKNLNSYDDGILNVNCAGYIKVTVFHVAWVMKTFVHQGWKMITDQYILKQILSEMKLIQDMLCPTISTVFSLQLPVVDNLFSEITFPIGRNILEASAELSHNITLFLTEVEKEFPM